MYLCINFHISTLLGSAPSPMRLQSVLTESKRTLEVPDRGLGGFWHTVCPKDTSRRIFEMVDVSRIHQGSCVSIFKFLPAREILHLLCVSRASSWSRRGRWRFLTGVSVVFDMVDVSGIHEGSYISIFISLPSKKVVQRPGSPECPPSVIFGV